MWWKDEILSPQINFDGMIIDCDLKLLGCWIKILNQSYSIYYALNQSCTVIISLLQEVANRNKHVSLREYTFFLTSQQSGSYYRWVLPVNFLSFPSQYIQPDSTPSCGTVKSSQIKLSLLKVKKVQERRTGTSTYSSSTTTTVVVMLTVYTILLYR